MSLYILGTRRDVDFGSINSDMIPSTPDTFDLGGVGSEWRNARIGLDLIVDGNLTVNGTTTTVNSSTLTVDDKNIELAATASPTDALADGGGLILKGTTDKTWFWNLASGAWESNQPIRTGNLELNGNTLFSTDVNGDIILNTNGVGNVVVKGQMQIEGGNPAIGRVLTGLDGNGLADWQVPNTGGWVDDGTVVKLATITDTVGIGTITPQAPLQVSGPGGVSVGGFPSGILHVTSDSGTQFRNAVITGHNLFGGNTQLWYLGSVSGSNDNIALINRQTGSLSLQTSGNGDILLTPNGTGKVDVNGDVNASGSITTPQLNADNLRLDLNTISNTDGVGGINLITPGQTVLILADKVAMQGTSIGATGSGSEYIRFRDDRTTITSAPNYVLAISRQNSGLISLFLGNDGNGDAIIVTGDNDLRIGNDVAGIFTENVRFTFDGNAGFGEPGPDTKLHVTDGGSAGVVTAFSGTIATFESPGDGFLSILTPDTGIRGILFGEPSSNIAGGIFYNDSGSPDGFQFRVNGNVTKMVIEVDGIGMGTTNPDVTALLDLTSVTKGFLPPRMTTTQIDAIASPAIGLESYDTTINKKKVFTGSEFKTLLTEDIGQVLVQETFASSNVRFFGELGLPSAQGWTDTATGTATIVLVTETVFGVVKQVVRHTDNTTGGATTSDIALTAQNWIDANAFGASYGGTERLDTAFGGSGFFSGLQANSAENPLATGNRRYGVLFDNSGGNLRVRESDNTGNAVIMDGTGGNPLVTFDEWFSWECVIPAGLGAAEFYINSILTTFVPVFGVNGGGLGTAIKIGSGSTSGANRIVFHDNFGVTIYEEASTKTLAATTMAGDVAQINIPDGKRDYTIILPDGNPRPIGSVLRLVANNLLGLISLENQNPAVPEILYNGLRTLVINIAVKETIEGVNIVSSGNVYLGFQTSDIAIFIQLSSSVTQDPVDTNPTVITFNTQDAIAGITHSTTVNPGEITIDTKGVYFISPQSQVGKTSGATKTDFDVFMQIDRGSGFVDHPNSTIKLTIKDSDITDVALKAIGLSLNVGDKIRMMQRVSSASVGMGLKATAAEVGPPTVPATPAISLDMHRISGLAV